MRGFTRNNCDADSQCSVDILRIDLRDRGVKPLPGFVDKASADLTLIFEGSGMGDIKFRNVIATGSKNLLTL